MTLPSLEYCEYVVHIKRFPLCPTVTVEMHMHTYMYYVNPVSDEMYSTCKKITDCQSNRVIKLIP